VAIAHTPANASGLIRIEAQLTVLRPVALRGTGHASHQDQAASIRHYIV
jgi:hypothetical protein